MSLDLVAGLVLALGPNCYDKFDANWCEPGDWVAWPAMENASCRIRYENEILTLLPDDRVVMVNVDPEKVAV